MVLAVTSHVGVGGCSEVGLDVDGEGGALEAREELFGVDVVLEVAHAHARAFGVVLARELSQLFGG